MTTTAIRLENIVLERPGGFRFVADLAIPSGARVALMGASGSGKSTLLDLVAGFETPDSGRVCLIGVDMTAASPAARPVAMLFQQDNLFGHLDAFANAGLGRSPGLRLSATDRADVMAALARVGLAGKEKRLPAQLSGGERQRVAIARILLGGKPALLLDEPFASLGPALGREMTALVAEIAAARAMTVLLVTHDPDEALGFAERTLFLDGGRIVADGPTREVLVDAPADIVRRYLHGH
ncbi:MAG: ATP-binding cassette domain-containing protein [Phyllobacteriaceae bacterium]|nr:ATP-binding cassette domain-containing protein [Phyllobacteriaceae bacterium]